MAILVIMESKGDPDRLLEATKDVARSAGPPQGLLARCVARTDDGIVLVHVWESADARSAWHNNPGHQEALRASGMATLVEGRLVREYETHHVELFPTAEQ
jgi:heme-degrading monooxygenase HmoA